MTTIDDALISIFPDFSQFNARLQEGLRVAESRVGDVKIQARVDASEVSRSISEAIRRADKVVTLSTRLDDREFKAKLSTLEHGDAAKITLRANLDAAKARLELALLSNDRTVTIKAEADVASAKKALEDLARSTGIKAVEEAKTKAASEGAAARKTIADKEKEEEKKRDDDRKSKLSLGFLGSAGAANLIQGPAIAGLIAAIAPVTGAVLGLASAFAVAGGASAVFGIAATGHIAQITAVMKQVKEQGQQLSDLPAPFQRLLPVLTQTQSSWNLFLQNTRGPVFTDFIAGLNIAQGLLSKFTPIVNAVAVGIRGALATVGDFASGPEVQRFLGLLQTEGPSAIQSLTRSALNLGAGLLDVVNGFMPAGSSMLAMIEGLTQRFKDWATSLQGSSSFQSFLQYAQLYGPKVLDVLVNLGETLGKIVIGLAPIGAAVTLLLQALTKLLAVMPPGVWTAISVAVAAWGLKSAGAFLMATDAMKKAKIALVEFQVVQALLGGGFSGGALAGVNALGVGIKTMLTSAMLPLGLAVGIGAIGLDIWSTKNQEASALVDLHRARVEKLADAIRSTGEKAGASTFLQDTIKQLEDTKVSLAWFERPIPEIFGKAPTKGVLEAAQQAGLSLEAVAKGATGDKVAFEQSTTAWEAYIKSLRTKSAATDSGSEKDRLNEEADLSQKALDAYKAMKVSKEDAVAVNERLKASGLAPMFDAEGNAIQQVTTLMGQYTNALAAATTDAQKLQQAQLAAFNTLQSSIRGLTEARYQEGQTAQQTALADVQAARAVKDAQHSYADAQLASKNATVALTKARQDATRALEDQGDKENAALIANQRAKAAAFAIGIKVDGPITPEYQLKQIEIQDALTDTTLNYNRTLEDGNKLRADGRDGAPAVVAAQKAKEDADYNESKSKQAVADAITNQTTTIENGKHSRELAHQATIDATAAEVQAQLAYDNSTTALTNVAGGAGVAQDKLSGLRGELSRALILDASNPLKQLQDMATYMEAIKLLATDPNMTFSAAWTEAQGHVQGTNVLPTVGGVTGPWAPGYTGVSNSGSLGAIGQRAMGGLLTGAGHGTSDSIPILASTGEYVLRAAAVDRLGVAYLDHLNQADKYAAGGQVSDPYGLGSKVKPWVVSAADFLGNKFGIKSEGGWRASDPFPDHPGGWAVDFMTNNLGAPASVNPKGQQLADYVTQHAKELNVLYEIWNRRSWNPTRGTWAPYTSTGNPHTDHVHVSFLHSGKEAFNGVSGTSTVPSSGTSSTSTTPSISRTQFDSLTAPLLAELKGSYLQTFASYVLNSLYSKLPSASTTTTSTGSVTPTGDVGAGATVGGVQGASQFGGPHDPGTGTHGYKGDSLIGKMAYAELSKNPKAKDFAALGGLPYKQKAHISYKGKTIDAEKLDIGGGGGDVSGHHRSVDLWYELANALGFPGTGLINFQTFAKGGPIRDSPIRDNGKVVADRGAILPPMSRTIVENRTSQNENVGFGTRLDEYSLQRLAQILSALKFQNYLDGKEMRDHINENFGHRTGTAGL